MSLDGKDLQGNKCHYVSYMGTKYRCKFTAAVQRDTIMAVIRNQLEYSLEIIRILKILQGEVNQLYTAKF